MSHLPATTPASATPSAPTSASTTAAPTTSAIRPRAPAPAVAAESRCAAVVIRSAPAARTPAPLTPTVPGVAIGVAVGGRILVAVRGLTNRGAVAVLACRAISRRAVRRLHRRRRPLGSRLMLSVCRSAVLRNRRASPASICIGALLRLPICPGSWVVRLTDALRSIPIRHRATTRVSAGGWVIAIAVMSGAVGAIPRIAGPIVAAMPGIVSVVRPAVIHDGGAAPAATPAAIAPGAATAAHHGTHRNANSKREDRSRRDVRRSVSRRYVGIPVNHRRVVDRNVHHLRICRLNHDGLWRWLRHHYL